MTCPFCNEDVKLNEIIRSASHTLGCVRCYGKPSSATVQAEAVVARTSRVARPFTLASD